MAGDPLSFAAFTLFPLVVLVIGIVGSIAFASLLDDWRILLATALFLLMAAHQGTEVWAYIGGADPYTSILGEALETAVNLLAVGTIGYVIWSLRTERQLRERLEIIQETLAEDEQIGEEVRALGERGARIQPDQPSDPAWRKIPGVNRLLGFLFTTLPLGTTADLPAVLGTAVQNVRITFPIAEFRVETEDSIAVLAEPTYLQEVLETVLERLVVYNDSSDPELDIEMKRGNTVDLVITHNGSGLPVDVIDRLTGETRDAGAGDLELAYVHSYLEKWGGSVSVTADTVEISLQTPRSVSNPVT